MNYQIKRLLNGIETVIKTVRPTGTQTKKAMGESVVDMSFTLPVYVEFKINDFVQVYGETYRINVMPSVKKVAARKYEYNIQFEAVFYDLAKVQLQFLNAQNQLLEPVFNLMGNAATIVGLIVENANRHSAGWTVGVVDDTPYQNFSFNAENCLQVLNRLASDFETEFWIDNKTIHLQKREQASGLQFEYGKGKGLYSIARANKSNANIITRLYVRGGSRNLRPDYGATSLLLPNGATYIEDTAKVALYGLIEATQIFENIFPEYEGTVSAVVAGDGNWDKFSDASIDFDVNSYALPTPAKVAFNTGQLAGYEFELSSYNNATKQFTIKQNNDEALKLPTNLIRPAVGDKFVLLDIRMPQVREDAAEAKLLAFAQAYYNKNSDPALNFAYSVDCDPIWFAQQNISVVLGNTVIIYDADLGINGEIRIAGFKRDLQTASKYELEISDSIGASEIIRQYAQQQRTLQLIESSGLLDINQIRKNIFLNRLSEQNGYLMLSGVKAKAGLADLATNALHADLADYALDADMWDGRQFSDYLNQPLRTTDDVRFKSITSTSYVSGALGSGFKIDENGDAVFDNLTVRKQFNVYELVLNKISGTNGALAVTDTIKIDTVTETPTGYDCTIDTGGNTIAVPFQVDDLLRCQVWNGTGLKYYFAKVTAVGNGTFTIDKASKVGTGLPASGDTVVRFGNTTNVNRQGLLYLTASDTNAPYLDVLDGVTSDNLAGKTKVRLGRLDGITDADLGALSGYGLFGQNVFVKGKIHVTGGNAETLTGSQAKADAAQNNAVNTASADATAKANAAQNSAVATASTDAQNKANAAQASAAGYTDSKSQATLTAAQTYADNSAQSKANAAQANAIASAASDAQAKADAAQAAANSLSQQLVNNLKVGGRNYQPNGEVRSVSGYIPVNNNPNFFIDNSNELRIAGGNASYLLTPQFIQSIPSDQTVTVSFWVKNNSSVPLTLLVSGNGNNTAVSANLSPNQSWFKVFNTFLVSNVIVGTELIRLMFECYTASTFDISIKHIKVEVGNKSSDWVPAIEDVQASIDAAKSAADVANAAYSALTASLKSMAFQDVVELSKLGSTIIQNGMIKTTLLDANYIKSNIVNAAYINALEIDASAIKSGTIDSARINAAQIIINGGGATITQAQNLANAAQNNAVATASSDAQNKANAAQAAAAGYTDTKSQTTLTSAQTYADNSAQSKANAAQANAIASAASDAQAKADAAQAAANSLSQQLVNGIKVGGRNYQPNGEIKSVAGYDAVSNISNLYVENSNELRIIGINAGYVYTPLFSQYVASSELVTLSFWVKNNTSVPLILSATANGNNSIAYTNIPSNQSWTKIVGTALLSNIIVGTQLTRFLFECYTGSTFDISIKLIKVEVGNKATDWTPAPEDVQSAINVAKNAADVANASYAALTASLKSLAYQDVVELSKLGSTIIENGMIKTTLLDANYIKSNIVNAAYITALDIVATKVAATQGYIGGFNIVNQSLVAGSNSDNPNSWDLNSSNIMLYTAYQLFRKVGNSADQTDEMSINLGYYPASSGLSYKDTLVLKNNILNTAQTYMPASALNGSGAVYRQKNRALVLEAKNSDENIALEVMSGHIYLRGVNDAGTVNQLRNGYIKYVNMNGRQVLVLDNNPTEVNVTLYGNTAQTATVQYSPCGNGEVGTTHSYTVPADTYKRLTQAEANTAAYQAALAQAQSNANNYGYCQMPEYRIVISNDTYSVNYTVYDVTGQEVALPTGVTLNFHVSTQNGSFNSSTSIWGSSGMVYSDGYYINDFWVNTWSPQQYNGVPITIEY